MKGKLSSFFINSFLFTPLILYLGKRSLIAYDEGIYVLQAKWILENNNWITPLKWGSIVNDRTIGIQFLIALSQKVFGDHLFAAYIPNILFGSLMIFLTYQLNKELTNKAWPIMSSIILCTTFLWINYFHMATQDLIFGSLTTLGIYSSIKSCKTKHNFYFFFAGIWIGLAFMLKTYLALIPSIAILPFLYSKKIYINLTFWIGIIAGFLPFLIWTYYIISLHGWESFTGIYNKLITLSGNNEFSNPFYYYLWNFPLNLFPWTIFSFFGFILSSSSKNPIAKYFLFQYPLLILILLSIFSTKTPYYPMQLLSITSINAYLGISYILKEKNFFTKYLKKIFFVIVPIFLLLILGYVNIKQSSIAIDEELIIVINIAIILFSICWLKVTYSHSLKRKLIFAILGPYLLTSLFVQSGVFNDRSRAIRIETQSIVDKLNLHEQKVEVITSGLSNEFATKKIIKISLFMPKLGNGLGSIDELKINQYAWASFPDNNTKTNEKYNIVYESKKLNPWKLIKK